MIATRIDHVVIVVHDLGAAARDLKDKGFTIFEGGRHVEGRTENVLVGFADGSYIEVIAFTDAPDARLHRWWPRLQEGEGLIDHALGVDDVAGAKASLERAGLRVSAVADGGRTRPDGIEVKWRSLHLGSGYGDPLLPFLIEDVTPHELRAPSGELARHANGLTGIAGIRLESPDVAATTKAYAAVVGGSLRVGDQRITIARGDARRFAALELRGGDGAIREARTHGPRLVVTP